MLPMGNVLSAFYPKAEMPIKAIKSGWAEQEPHEWWNNLKEATQKILNITSVLISYKILSCIKFFN